MLVDQGQLSDVKLHACSAQRMCRAECCSQGVRIEPDEAHRIAEFVRQHPVYFKHLDRVERALVPLTVPEFGAAFFTEIVTPDGPGRHGIRNAAATRKAVSPDDCRNSMCVFALEDRRCSLQVASVALGLHPWTFKPTGCWLFPLKYGVHGGRGQKKYYRLDWAGADRPEVANYPCSRLEPDGKSAAKVLREEIAYFRRRFVD